MQIPHSLRVRDGIEYAIYVAFMAEQGLTRLQEGELEIN